jgi:hypothetical protein
MNREWRAYCAGDAMTRAVTEGTETSRAGCEVYIHDSIRGTRVETWTVGEQVNEETYDKFKDRNGYLYVLVYYEKGEPNATFVAKPIWDRATELFADIDKDARPRHFRNTNAILVGSKTFHDAFWEFQRVGQ